MRYIYSTIKLIKPYANSVNWPDANQLRDFLKIKLAKKLKVDEIPGFWWGGLLFPLIKLAKKLKAVGAIHELPLLRWMVSIN